MTAKSASVWSIPGVLPVYGVFFAEAFILGNWIPRIPEVKALFGLSASELGLFLFTISFGTLFSFLCGGRLVKSWGVAKTCWIAAPLWAVAVGIIPFALNGYVLAIIGLAAGIGVGLTEIGMNTAADKLEIVSGRRLMSKAHGFWSLGSLVGAVMGTQFAYFEVPLTIHFPVAMGAAGIGAFYMARRFPAFQPRAANQEKSTPAFQLPNRSMVLLCLMPIGIMVVEGAFIDWSALFVRDVLNAGPLAIGSIFAAFAAVMTVTRLCGDWLQDRFGPLIVARVSAISATFGIAMFAFAPNVPIAFFGALLSGLGVAIFYPLVMTAAARRPGDAEDNVAAMSMFAFTSFMLAPPTIGFIADLSDLRVALSLLVPLAFTSLLLTGQLKLDSDLKYEEFTEQA